MQPIIFDDAFSASFYPLSLTRPVFELRCGILKLRQRLENCFEDADNTCVWMEDNLVKLYQERHPDWEINSSSPADAIYVNSRLQISEASLAALKKLTPESCLCTEDSLVAARTEKDFQTLANSLPASIELSLRYHYGQSAQSLRSDTGKTAGKPSAKPAAQTKAQHDLKKLTVKKTNLPLYACLSDLIHDNARMLEWDFQHYFYDQDNFFETEPGVTVLHPYNVWLGEGVSLAPGVVIDAAAGPVVIDEGAQVMANAVLCGPLYLGKHSLIKIGAKIYGGTSIGKVCKIGGEVEGTIFQGYANKQHDGFLGHAYIGEWVNLGADTNNSDLKNTYKNVAYYSYQTRSKLDSGSMFLGCVIGDHSKTGINCSINTGAVIGTGCNLWGRALISDFVPDFSWGEADKLDRYRFEAFCATARLVKQRRKLDLTVTEKAIYNHIFNLEN